MEKRGEEDERAKEGGRKGVGVRVEEMCWQWRNRGAREDGEEGIG